MTVVNVDETQRVFRVTVRGRFGELSDQAQRYLAANQAEHDIFVSAYTPEGSFTYDNRVDFFNLRYEVRAGGDDPVEAAGAAGRLEAETFLDTMKFAHRDLKVAVVDMAALWAAAPRRRS